MNHAKTDETRFFVFDGVDGAGKSTQIQRCAAWLESRGHHVTLCREPGTTVLGEQIRDLLLNSDIEIDTRAEMLLYQASRAQLVDQVIRPALARGETVIADRYLLANVVYQGHAGGLAPEAIWRVGQIATNGLEPTLTIVLDVDLETAARRREAGGAPDRLERRSRQYFQDVRTGFLTEAANNPQRITVVDAAADAQRVHRDVQHAIERFLQSETRP